MSYIGTTEIGKMYLGSTEIEKAYLGSTLVYQRAAPAPASYVTNGLVLWLDGIDQGSTANHWIDKVNNIDFYASGGATFNSDHLYFNGTSNYLSNSSFTPPTASAGTIEVVFEAEDSGRNRILFMPKNVSGAIAFGLGSSGSAIYNLSPSKAVYSSCPTSGSVSISYAGGYANGSALSTGSSSSWSYPNNTYNYVGRRNRSNNYCYFKGKIYCIRIYNRQLTQAEIMSNLAVDNTRFNLGLTL